MEAADLARAVRPDSSTTQFHQRQFASRSSWKVSTMYLKSDLFPSTEFLGQTDPTLCLLVSFSAFSR